MRWIAVARVLSPGIPWMQNDVDVITQRIAVVLSLNGHGHDVVSHQKRKEEKDMGIQGKRPAEKKAKKRIYDTMAWARTFPWRLVYRSCFPSFYISHDFLHVRSCRSNASILVKSALHSVLAQ